MNIKNNKVVRNASWLIGCKIIQSIFSFAIGIITVRYLGPSNYGLISYVSAIVAFFVPIMQLGFPSVLVNEIVNHPDDEGKILGTSLMFNLISAIASVVGIVIFVSVANAGEKETILVCSLYSLNLIFQATEIMQYWFQAKLMSKYSSIVSLIAYVIVAIYKIYILVSGKSVLWFSIIHVIEYFIISILLMLLYRKFSSQKLSFSYLLGKQILSKSQYYILSGLLLVIFTQTDKIMLKFMVDEIETGYYAAALTCIGITSFVFSSIIDSARPSIFEAKKHSEELFEKSLLLLFSVVIYLSFLQSIFMTVFSNLIVLILYGQSYMPAGPILKIAVWYVTFSNIGSVESIWIVSENKQKYLPLINLFGAVLNIFVNILLIPTWGACGAALASVFTQVFSKFFLFLLIKPMRPIGKIMLKSFNPMILIDFLRKEVRR